MAERPDHFDFPTPDGTKPLTAEALGVDLAAPSTNRDLSDFSPFKKQLVNWTGREAAKYGFSDKGDDQQINAFRHGVISALYTLKYGSFIASELGWANEQKDFNIYKSLTGQITLDKIADTNADLLNNKAGRKIAADLIEEKGGADKVTVRDIEDRVAREIRDEHLVVHPHSELEHGQLASETLSYHSMRGLIKWEAKHGPTQADRDEAARILRVRDGQKP